MKLSFYPILAKGRNEWQNEKWVTKYYSYKKNIPRNILFLIFKVSWEYLNETFIAINWQITFYCISFTTILFQCRRPNCLIAPCVMKTRRGRSCSPWSVVEILFASHANHSFARHIVKHCLVMMIGLSVVRCVERWKPFLSPWLPVWLTGAFLEISRNFLSRCHRTLTTRQRNRTDVTVMNCVSL